MKQDSVKFNHGKIVNIHIVYEIERSVVNIGSYPALENCFFGEVKLNMLMLICTNIQDMVSDSIEKDLIQLEMKSVECDNF